MLDNVLSGAEWQGVVLVPYSLMRYLGVQQHADTIIDFARADDQSSNRQPFEEMLEPDEDEEFQIGESRLAARKRQSAAFFLKQQGNTGSGSDLGDKRSGQSFLHAQPSGEIGATSPLGAGTRISVAGGEDGCLPGGFERSLMSHAGRTSMSVSMSGGGDLAIGSPSLANRKFMTLLSTKGPSPLNREGTHPNLMIIEETVKNLSRLGRHEADEESEVMVEGEEADDYKEEIEEEEVECYHEIHAIPLLDPVLDKQVVMLVQTDVTPRVELENKLADLTDAQLSMLEQLFPRHIIEHMLAKLPTKVGKNIKGLANNHDKVRRTPETASVLLM
jgi:hypothetical protein